MRKLGWMLAVVVAAVVCWQGGGYFARSEGEGKGKEKGPMVGHMVYFNLKDKTPAAKQKLVDACKKYLTNHPGTVFYAAGTLSEDLKREVNVTDWDVALQLVFADKEAHDKYQVAERHDEFIKQEKGNWEKVRVFDAYVTK